MYIRKTQSRNSTCFQIGKKEQGRFKLIKHVGCAQDPAELEAVRLKAHKELLQLRLRNQLSLFPQTISPKAKLISWQITGFHQIFGSVYDGIGFPPNLLRDLVIARIVYPGSKLATVRYLNDALGIPVSRNTVYRFLDTLDKEQLTRIAYQFVAHRHRQQLTLIFYDVTTLYFETATEDQLRSKGYSKDHRHDMPQILIGLFVDQDGYPFDFDFFEGKTFEGHTLPKMVTYLKSKYTWKQLTIVADAGMLSQDNLAFLDSQGIGYIVGARLKNLPQTLKDAITTHEYTKAKVLETQYQGRRLLVDYSIKRAKRDQANRDRKIKKLRQKLEKKQSLVSKSKYLKTKGENRVVGIDEAKVLEDAQYDGLKGYLTNQQSQLPHQTIISHYHNLWQVEKAFRMSKHDLQERPVYHSKPQRIKAHLTLCFVSLLVMKETERILNLNQYSLKQAIKQLNQVGQGKIRIGKTTVELESELDEETQSLLSIFAGHWKGKVRRKVMKPPLRHPELVSGSEASRFRNKFGMTKPPRNLKKKSHLENLRRLWIAQR